ncbi:MAG TPA: helix-turn-helix domain-containing protein, partial [Marmoricola sp.]
LLPSSQRTVRWQRRLHGAPLAVPLSIGTRCTSAAPVSALKELASGRTDVVAARTEVHVDIQAVTGRARTTAGRLLAIGTQEDDGESLPAPAVVAPRIDPVSAIRDARRVVRAEVVREAPPRPEPERVLPEPVANPGAVVFDDLVPQGAATPVIGNQIRAARLRAGLDVDELSERTRIRPHVLESVEVDDFAPCGGDFYARGHLTTLARYLGLDADDLLDTYDDTYAHAPISASRVFEAELATGMSGGMRATTGGPRWGLIAAAVMALLMVWGVARYFTEPANETAGPVVSDSAGLAANTKPITSPLTRTRTVTVVAVGPASQVEIRDRKDKVLWSGVMHEGDHRRLAGLAPFTVTSTHGSAVQVSLGKDVLGTVGADTTPAKRSVG